MSLSCSLSAFASSSNSLRCVWPVVPTQTMVVRGIWKDSFYKHEIGWPELTDSVVRVWEALPGAGPTTCVPATQADVNHYIEAYGELLAELR